MNKDRFSRLARQKTGRKMDFLFLHQTKELGCGECGLVGGVNTTKELCDAGFKMPKVMRDMLVKAVAMSPALKRDLLISGIYIGEMKLKVVLLDSPCGYVTRYDAMNDVTYPENESELCRKLSAIVRTILGFRMLMAEPAKSRAAAEAATAAAAAAAASRAALTAEANEQQEYDSSQAKKRRRIIDNNQAYRPTTRTYKHYPEITHNFQALERRDSKTIADLKQKALSKDEYRQIIDHYQKPELALSMELDRNEEPFELAATKFHLL